MSSISKASIDRIDALKAAIEQHRPLTATARAQLKSYFRIGLTYSSNALEGNSLTETETKVILEDGLTISGKPLKDHLEAIGHAAAFDFIYTCLQKKKLLLNDILEMHRLFYQAIDRGNAGTLRPTGIIVTGTNFAFPKPLELPTLMNSFIDQLHEWEVHTHPVEAAAKAHLKLVTIHPFTDGNGRTARLLMNTILLRHGYPITIIPPILRATYIAATRAGNFGDDTDFLQLIADVVYESCKEYLRLLHEVA